MIRLWTAGAPLAALALAAVPAVDEPRTASADFAALAEGQAA